MLPLCLSHGPQGADWELDFDLTGGFSQFPNTINQKGRQSDITNSVWKELILNQGRKQRQGQKKEVGGETKTATQPDAAVELEPKYSSE